MAIESIPTDLGQQLPPFELTDIDGVVITDLDIPEGSPSLIMFLCNHCPGVQDLEQHLAKTMVEVMAAGIFVLAISTNDPIAYSDDDEDHMRVHRARAGFTFAYALDHSQEVSIAFEASCTPDFMLYNQSRKRVYHGQYDASRPGNGEPITGSDLLEAIGHVLEQRKVEPDQWPSFGCSIKWKPGNEPDYL